MPTRRFAFHRIISRPAGGFLIVLLVSANITAGQIPGVDIWPDADTDTRCDLVNAANAELVVLTGTRELVLISAEDIILEGTFVNTDGAVFLDDDPVGSLRFAEDADGLVTLWWLAANGRVIHIDGISFEVAASELLPSDIGDTTCAACDGFWDIEEDCPDPAPFAIFQFYGSGFGMLIMGASLFGLVGLRANTGCVYCSSRTAANPPETAS